MFFFIGALVDREAVVLHSIEASVESQIEWSGAAVPRLQSAEKYQESYEAKRAVGCRVVVLLQLISLVRTGRGCYLMRRSVRWEECS